MLPTNSAGRNDLERHLAFFKGLFDRILSTIDNKVDNETERERIKTEAVQTYVNAQAQVLNGRGWWFPIVAVGSLWSGN